MKLPAWWPWVSRKRYELTDVARRSAAYDAHMARGALREAERERTEARAEVERIREDRDRWASAAREAYELLREQRATYVEADNVYRVLGDLLQCCDEDVQALFDKEDREMGLYGEPDDEA